MCKEALKANHKIIRFCKPVVYLVTFQIHVKHLEELLGNKTGILQTLSCTKTFFFFLTSIEIASKDPNLPQTSGQLP